MGKFFIKGKETTGPEDWKIGLAEPEKQWKSGYSAKALAYSWEESGGIPPEVNWVLSQCEYPLLREPEMLLPLQSIRYRSLAVEGPRKTTYSF